MTDNARVIEAILNEDGTLNKLVVEQEDHTISELSVTPKGVPIVRAFPFAFDTPDLLTGAAVYTPTIGDILLDAWFNITEPWDGTTPYGDINQVGGDIFGYFDDFLPIAVAMNITTAERDWPSLSGWAAVGAVRGSIEPEDFTWVESLFSLRSGIHTFTTDDAIRVWVSQDGANDGADPESTQGAAILYLVTTTPA